MLKERPVLSGLINEGITEIEQFQNNVLRPIIKKQHVLLIASFQNYLQKRKVDFTILTEEKKRSRISSILKTDTTYKNLVLGFVIGHFSMEEFTFYGDNSSEINRRIVQIISQRIKDSISEL